MTNPNYSYKKLSNDMYVGFCARRDYVDKLKAEMEELKAEVVKMVEERIDITEEDRKKAKEILQQESKDVDDYSVIVKIVEIRHK